VEKKPAKKRKVICKLCGQKIEAGKFTLCRAKPEGKTLISFRCHKDCKKRFVKVLQPLDDYARELQERLGKEEEHTHNLQNEIDQLKNKHEQEIKELKKHIPTPVPGGEGFRRIEPGDEDEGD
jgi:hypothetical protein